MSEKKYLIKTLKPKGHIMWITESEVELDESELDRRLMEIFNLTLRQTTPAKDIKDAKRILIRGEVK